MCRAVKDSTDELLETYAVRGYNRLNNSHVIVVQEEPKKNYCKGKGYILIDDFEGNINDWDNAGGTGIRFTTPEDAKRKIQECEKF